MPSLRCSASFSFGSHRCDRRHEHEGGMHMISNQKTAAVGAVGSPSSQLTSKTAIRPFRVNIPEAELTDLRRRIEQVRLPDRETVTDFSQGVPAATTEKLARYWATEYDWRKCEARLNKYPQFITEIDGLDIHFIHVRSKH